MDLVLNSVLDFVLNYVLDLVLDSVLDFVLDLVLDFVAVCTYCLVMISIERSETAQKSALEIQDKFSLRQNAVQDKIQSKNFFSNGWEKIFFPD